jgi:hypothetical protein
VSPTWTARRECLIHDGVLTGRPSTSRNVRVGSHEPSDWAATGAWLWRTAAIAAEGVVGCWLSTGVHPASRTVRATTTIVRTGHLRRDTACQDYDGGAVSFVPLRTRPHLGMCERSGLVVRPPAPQPPTRSLGEVVRTSRRVSHRSHQDPTKPLRLSHSHRQIRALIAAPGMSGPRRGRPQCALAVTSSRRPPRHPKGWDSRSIRRIPLNQWR